LAEEGGSRAESSEVLAVSSSKILESNRRPSTPLGGVLVNTTTTSTTSSTSSTKEWGKPDELFISR
jgi:hypothetical protein